MKRIAWMTGVICALAVLGPPRAIRADVLSGTVKDPTGAAVPGARVIVKAEKTNLPVIAITDNVGRFKVPNLPAGNYTLHVEAPGFADFDTPVKVNGTTDISLSLVAGIEVEETVVTPDVQEPGNTDPVYKELRKIKMGDSYVCGKMSLVVDAGTFEFETGTMTLLAPVRGQETGAVFFGTGYFTLKPATRIDTQELRRRSGSEVLEEDFSSVVFRFTDGVFRQFLSNLHAKAADAGNAEELFSDWQKRVRHRSKTVLGMTQELLEGERMDNVDADELAGIYNPNHPMFFNAYLHGAKHKDLRYFVRARGGAVTGLESPEETALINYDQDAADDGVWYMQHLQSELKSGTANSGEERRTFAARSYKIETTIEKNEHLRGRAELTFVSLIAGERVMKFGLLPTLRVMRVADANGKDLNFIQEGKDEDGSFYAILDSAPEVDKEQTITVDYAGTKVLTKAGDGSYYVGARDSWYPNLNGFGEMAKYDLIFRIPPSNEIISVGKLLEQKNENGYAMTRWVTPSRVAVAGFNYGRYKKMDLADPVNHYAISGYYLEGATNFLPMGGSSPQQMTQYALAQALAQLEVCTQYFGRAPYEGVNITEQPNFSFGQSWPGLIYLPVVAYIDSTQRWLFFGMINNGLNGFVQEVTPHEVAHQWFGHSVGWATYHDEWLSEGFAEFAAGLFLEKTSGPKWQKDYIDFWDRQRKEALDKNEYVNAPADVAPLWLGLRLISPRSENAYQGATYAKGAYVLSMLRSLLYDDHADSKQDPDHVFMEMMQDFVNSHRDRPATTESFKKVVERHMPKTLDLQGNGRLDWFFNEWVYGTQVPHYELRYEQVPTNDGTVKMRVNVTQSGVDDNFAMFVPIFADFGKGAVRLGQIPVIGNSTRSVIFDMDRKPKKVEMDSFHEILAR